MTEEQPSFVIVLHGADGGGGSTERFVCGDAQLDQLGGYFTSLRTSPFSEQRARHVDIHLGEVLYWNLLVHSTGCTQPLALAEARKFLELTCLQVALPSDAAFPLHIYLAHVFDNQQVLARLWPPLDTVPMVNNKAFALLFRLIGARSAAVQRRHATHGLMRRLSQCAPDVAYGLTHEFRYLHEYEKAVLTRGGDESEPLIMHARSLLAIDAHAFCNRPEPREFGCQYQQAVTLQQYLVPPPCSAVNAPWLLDLPTAQRRLKWATYGLLKNAEQWLFDSGDDSKIVLSGSLLPLCFLASVYKTDDRAHFVDYAEENYRARSVDLFIYGANAETTRELVLERLAQRTGIGGTISFVRRSQVEVPVGVNARTPPLAIYEYVVQMGDEASDRSVRVQIVCMYEAREPVDTFLFHHLPLVRAGYTGSALLVTPMCLVSWRFRVCMGHVSFSRHLGADSEQWGADPETVEVAVPDAVRRHWSRLLLKWACRGFAFAPNPNWGLPRTIRDWVQEAGPGPLPWYHPLYAPSSWSRFLSDEEVHACLECAGPL